MEAGLDSLAAVELRNALAEQFRVELPATLTFDYPSISAIAAFIGTVLTAEAPVMQREFSGSDSFSKVS